MDDMLKKVINTGVGLFALGNKRVQTALDKLVQESKLSEQEGQKIMDELRKTGETKRKQFEKQVQDLAGSLRGRVGLNSDEQEAPAEPQAAASKAKKPAAKTASPAKKTASKVSDATAKPKRPTAKARAAKEAAEGTAE